MNIRAVILLGLVAAIAPLVATSLPDLVPMINGIRAQGCARQPGVQPELRHDARLDRAARALASGTSLHQALTDSGYRAVQSATLEVSGSDAGMERALAERGCKDIADPVYHDVGFAERGGRAWIILGAPLVSPPANEAQAVGRRVLELANEARARPRRCGWKRFAAAPPLAMSDTLTSAASAHARDMAGRSTLSHTGRDGTTAGERTTRSGYQWRVVGENIAAGQSTPEQVVAEWVRSPRHCANLMDADFSEMGVAFAVGPRSAAGIYWAQVFAAPRQ